jgi:hypothetical protein
MTNQNDPSLDFECPICGAVPKEKCTLYSGGPRFESHLERHDVAEDRNFKPTVRLTTSRSMWPSKPIFSLFRLLDDPEAFRGGGQYPRTLSASLGSFCLNQHGSDYGF